MTLRTDPLRPLPPALAHGGLVIVIVHVFVSAYTMQEPTSFVAIVTQAMFYIILGVILVGVSNHRLEVAGCVTLVCTSTVLRIMFDPEARIAHASADAALVGCGILALVRSIQRMLNTRTVTPALISAAITTYLLAGVIWTIGFHAIETIRPGSFLLSGSTNDVNAGELSYFSFVTLTTLGYGDGSPATPIARSLATSEAVVGQVFLVVLLGRLVSLQITSVRPSRLPAPRSRVTPPTTQQQTEYP